MKILRGVFKDVIYFVKTSPSKKTLDDTKKKSVKKSINICYF